MTLSFCYSSYTLNMLAISVAHTMHFYVQFKISEIIYKLKGAAEMPLSNTCFTCKYERQFSSGHTYKFCCFHKKCVIVPCPFDFSVRRSRSRR